MAILLMKILWYKIDNRYKSVNGVPEYTNPVNITNVVSASMTRGIDVKNNVFNFVVKNLYDDYVDDNDEIKFNEEDQIKVYAKYTEDGADIGSDAWDRTSPTEPSSDYLLGTYYVVQYGFQDTITKDNIRVECADKTYILFSRLVSESFLPSDNLTAPEAIQKVIRIATENQDGLYSGTGDNAGVLYDVDARLSSNGGYITDTRRGTREDGTTNTATDFPVISMAKIQKPVYEWIEDLSQPEQTNTADELTDGVAVYGKEFIYWIDEDNKFHWVYPDSSTTTSISFENDYVTRTKFNKRVFDAYNMIIYDCGDDLEGVGIWDYFYDDTSDIKGLKQTFKSMTDITKDMLDRDYQVNTTRESGKRYQYPTDASYPLTPSWASTSVANDSEYNDSLITEAKKRGKTRAMKMTKKLANAKWKGSFSVRGQKFNVGDLLDVTFRRDGLVNTKLRVTDVNHTFSRTGWTTTVDLKQDAEAIIETDTL